jgi:predicted GIY-YIG superfamily endonuclease
MQGVYLVHLNDKLSNHAQHYIGYAEDIKVRYYQHGTKYGARMLYVARERELTWVLARIWPQANRKFERKLKNRKNAKYLCPICNPKLTNVAVLHLEVKE